MCVYLVGPDKNSGHVRVEVEGRVDGRRVLRLELLEPTAYLHTLLVHYPPHP